MPYIENLEYLNFNQLRAYPIRELLSRLDTLNQLTIPDDFIVDISIAASSDVSTRLYISRIFNKLSSIVIEISDFSNVVVGTFTIVTADFNVLQSYSLVTATGIYAKATGRITIGTLDTILTLSAGIYVFTSDATELEPKTVIPSVQGVNSITFIDDTGVTQTLSGNVNIVTRTNLRFSYDSATNTITLDAGDGLGLNVLCDTTPSVKMINGVKPNPADGNISFTSAGCSVFSSPAPNTLEFADNCCTPCSGCDDLAELTSRVQNLEAKYIDAVNFQTYLQSQLNGYLATVNSNCVCPS